MFKKIKEFVTKLDGKLYWSVKSVEKKIIVLKEKFFPTTVNGILDSANNKLLKLADKKYEEANTFSVQSMFYDLKSLEAKDEGGKACSAMVELYNLRG